MSGSNNPHGPQKPDDRPEPEKAADAAEQKSSGLTFDDVLKMAGRDSSVGKSDATHVSRGGKDAPRPANRDLSGLPRAAFSYNPGQYTSFQLRKAEFLHEREKPVHEIKPLVDRFLKDTKVPDDSQLTAAQKREITETRESLTKSSSADEVVSKALQLGKLYQHLRYIEEAKKATDLSLGIDPENNVGRELFKELERMHPPDIGVTSPKAAPRRRDLTKSNLRERIANLAGGRVIVLGDLLIDELLEGRPERISREAPVLILEHVDTELIPGGAANTANNIAALGGTCHAIGVCGRDEYAAKLAGLFEKVGITHSLVQDPSRPTTVKTRFLSKSHSFSQQLLRLDRISHEPISPLVESMLVDRLRESAGQYKAVVLSDYRAGVMTDGIIKACSELAARQGLMVIVDAQHDFARFQNVTLMTPNQPDTEKVVGYPINDDETLRRAGEDILMLTGARAVLVTRGAEGMVLFEKDKEPVQLAAFNRTDVFDVTGAGDTVAATISLALVTGCDFVEAMALGNLAASIVVRKMGTATTTRAEMLEALDGVKLPD